MAEVIWSDFKRAGVSPCYDFLGAVIILFTKMFSFASFQFFFLVSIFFIFFVINFFSIFFFFIFSFVKILIIEAFNFIFAGVNWGRSKFVPPHLNFFGEPFITVLESQNFSANVFVISGIYRHWMMISAILVGISWIWLEIDKVI